MLRVLFFAASTAFGVVGGQPQPPFGSRWFRSYDAGVNLSVAAVPGVGDVLTWAEPQHFSAIFTYLPAPLPLASAGQTVRLAARWRSSGDNVCPPQCTSKGQYCQSEACQKTKCQSKSVSCLSGTGDFRIALLDTTKAVGKVTADNWCPAGVEYKNMTKCLTAEPFPEMMGYDFRIFPHLTKGAKHEPGQVPCSIYRKNSTNLFGKHPRLGEWGCFGTPLGEWTTLELFITRKTPDTLIVGMTMNGVTYEGVDTNPATDPTAITRVDAVAIGYPNGRHYTYVDLAAVAVSVQGSD